MAANWWSHWEHWWHEGEWGHRLSTTHKRSLIRPVPSRHSPSVSVWVRPLFCHPSRLISLISLQVFFGNVSPPHGRSSVRASGGITTSHSFALLLVLKTGIQRRHWPSKVQVPFYESGITCISTYWRIVSVCSCREGPFHLNHSMDSWQSKSAGQRVDIYVLTTFSR